MSNVISFKEQSCTKCTSKSFMEFLSLAYARRVFHHNSAHGAEDPRYTYDAPALLIETDGETDYLSIIYGYDMVSPRTGMVIEKTCSGYKFLTFSSDSGTPVLLKTHEGDDMSYPYRGYADYHRIVKLAEGIARHHYDKRDEIYQTWDASIHRLSLLTKAEVSMKGVSCGYSHPLVDVDLIKSLRDRYDSGDWSEHEKVLFKMKGVVNG